MALDHDTGSTLRTMTGVRSLLPVEAVGVDLYILRVVGACVMSDYLRIELILMVYVILLR